MKRSLRVATIATDVAPRSSSPAGRCPRVVMLSLALMLTLGSSLGRADDQNRALAQSLYDEGLKLMESGQVAEGCKKLETSDKLFQGIGVKGRLGECYEKQGLLASAWSAYRSALSLAEAKNDARSSELRSRAQSLEGRLSHLTIDASAARVAGMVIKRDGLDLPEPLWGTKIPLDGGSHTVEVSAPEKKVFRTTVSVKNEMDEVSVVVPKLDSTGSSSTPPISTTPVIVPSVSVTSPAPTPSNPVPENRASVGMSPLRTTGLVSGIVGVAGLGLAGAFAAIAVSKNSDSKVDNHCNAANVCDSTGASLRNDAKSAANLATVFVIGGGVLFAGGATMFLVGSPRQQTQGHVRLAPLLATQAGGLSLRGAW